MVDEAGEEMEKERFSTTYEGLDDFAGDLPEGAKVAIEASTSGIFVWMRGG
ncbi:MAG: hypothetical protein N2V78_07915 [Methanophagales archaeon]|nr:hypothetical protein [Methanophagales archaeon]